MRNLILPAILIFNFYQSLAQNDHQNINFLGSFDDPNVTAEPFYGIRYQGCWGWTDESNNREYGIIGSTAGTYIIEVTDPNNPVQRDYVATRRGDCIWHEYKTYGKYLYMISDDGGNNSLQIADLSYLPDSVHVVYDDTDILVHAHTLTIDGDKLYIGIVTTTTDRSSMNVYSLSNPEHPTLLHRLDDDFPFIGSVHDMFVVNDTVYANCGYDGLFIFHYDIINNQFLLLGSLQDGFDNYNHSSFLSPDHKLLYMCEEVPDGRPVKVVDVSDISNPTVVHTFFSHAGATPHNPFVVGNLLIIAYYQDGVYTYDISNPESPVEAGYFDTFPDNLQGSYLQPAYSGSWSAYAEFPSGLMITSDTKYGLFCLDMSSINGIKDQVKDPISIYPTPATNHLYIHGGDNFKIDIVDLNGKNLLTTKKYFENLSIDLTGFSKGVYVIKMSDRDRFICKRIVIG